MQSFAHYALPGIVVSSGVGALLMCLLVLRYGLESPDAEPVASPERRLLFTRVGHAVAGACFAVTAVLAVVLIAGARGPAPRSPETELLGTRVDALAARLDQLASRAAGADDRVSALADRLVGIDKRVGVVDARVTAGDRSRGELDARLAAAESAVRGMNARLHSAAASRPRPALQPVPVPTRDSSASPRLSRPESTVDSLAPIPARTPARDPVGSDARPVRVTPPTVTRALETPGRSAVRSEPASAPARSRNDPSLDLGAKFRGDWEAMKRDARASGRQIRDGFGELRRSLGRLFTAD